MVYQEIIELETQGEVEVKPITGRVEKVVEDSGVENGLCHIFNLGSTGSIFVNENESRLKKDFKDFFSSLTKKEKIYRHPRNAHSHLRAASVGPGETVPVVDGRLELGTWQELFFIEFDIKSRKRRIRVTVTGD
ncbi:MAG: secondary thiamine-phosphate synthase enzyme YjbQ [Candidatus Aenigmatarchaeota archaeon]